MIKILKFQANWCAPCKALAPILKDIITNTDIIIEEINIDDNEELCEYYDIRSIPTLIFFKDDEQVFKTVGSKTRQQIEDIINKL